MSDSILVTGATGFIGSHLVAALRTQGRRVIAHGSADADLSSAPPAAEAAAHVVHLAARSFVPDSWQAPQQFYAVNVVGTVNVLEFCRRTGAPFTFVSSYVYGRPRTLPIDESHPLKAVNPYSHTKILAEQVIDYYRAQFGIAATIIRPFNIYGPGQDARFVIPTIVGQALDPAAARIVVRDVRPRRDFLHVSDLVALLLAAIAAPGAGVFNAGSGRSIGILEVVDAIQTAAGTRKPVHDTGEHRPEEVLDVVADTARARRELGWEPRVDFRDGVRETVEWARTGLAAAR